MKPIALAITALLLGGCATTYQLALMPRDSGKPSLRRRLWPIGYSTATSASFLPSRSSTVSALAIERLAGSW